MRKDSVINLDFHCRYLAYQNPDDYERKYPEDLPGEELAAGARVWRTYLDEAKIFDDELLGGWKDTTDSLLIFVRPASVSQDILH